MHNYFSLPTERALVRFGEDVSPREVIEVVPQQVVVYLRVGELEESESLVQVVMAIRAHPREETHISGRKQG